MAMLAGCGGSQLPIGAPGGISAPNKAHGKKHSQTFSYTGAEQNFMVPKRITNVTVTASGASGGLEGFTSKYQNSGSGGLGGRITATIPVTPGETLDIFVGGAGDYGGLYAGYNGGGEGGSAYSCSGICGWGGGGASDVRQGGDSLADRVVVAGGGAGAGTDYRTGGYLTGGYGGGKVGSAGEGSGGSGGGGAGTQSSGGSGGHGGKKGCCRGGGGASGALGQGAAAGRTPSNILKAVVAEAAAATTAVAAAEEEAASPILQARSTEARAAAAVRPMSSRKRLTSRTKRAGQPLVTALSLFRGYHNSNRTTHMRSLVRSLVIGAAAMLAGCGGSQPPIGAPGAMPLSMPLSDPCRHAGAAAMPIHATMPAMLQSPHSITASLSRSRAEGQSRGPGGLILARGLCYSVSTGLFEAC